MELQSNIQLAATFCSPAAAVTARTIKQSPITRLINRMYLRFGNANRKLQRFGSEKSAASVAYMNMPMSDARNL